MTIDEILRRVVRAHLALIVICVLLSVAAAAALEVRTPTTYVAHVRLQTLSSAPTSPTEADALSSGVLAVATNPPVVRTALDKIGAPSSADDAADVAAHDVTARRLGESAIVELTVMSPDSSFAEDLATALAAQVIVVLNSANWQGYQGELETIEARKEAAGKAVDRLRTQFLAARGPRNRSNISTLLTAAQRSLNQVEDERAGLVLSAVNRDVVTPLGVREPTVERVPSSLAPRSALALLLGLLVGLTLAVVLETVRPRLAGVRALARALAAPRLGSTSQTSAALANSMTLAARRQCVETLVVVGVDARDEKQAKELLREMPQWWAPDPADDRVSVPDRPPVENDGFPDAMTADSLTGRGPGAPEATPLSLSWPVRFTDRFGLTAAEELSAGVVVVSAGSALRADLDVLQDMLHALRLPVVGIVAIDSRRFGRRKS